MTIQALQTLAAVLLLSISARFLQPVRARQLVLLLASYFFYASWGGPSFLAVLITSSLMNYGCGVLLRRRPTIQRLWVGVGLNVALLAFFKYLPPLFNAQTAGTGQLGFVSDLVMPLGISFWTFQALSYLFDVYREEEIAPTLLEFCLYLAFWPTVTSGPICRLPDMLPQFRQPLAFHRDNLLLGLRRLVQGVIMKFGLAEMLGAGLVPGEGVSAGFDYYSSGWGGVDVWLLALGFGFQLFFDFAGYSYMVIGVARIYGFRLPENFDRPYLSNTPSIFWTRWHMSLSSWIRDYVFMPLAAWRRDRWWPHVALITSMTLFGIWHGANWTFVLWGVYHGVLLALHRLVQQIKREWTASSRAPAGQWLSCSATFVMISLGWIFFRANHVEQAVTMARTVFSYEAYGRFNLPISFYIVTPALITGYFVFHALQARLEVWKTRYQQQPALTGFRAFTLELDELVKQRTAWWLAPFTVAVLLVAVILAISPDPRVASFIYTAF